MLLLLFLAPKKVYNVCGSNFSKNMNFVQQFPPWKLDKKLTKGGGGPPPCGAFHGHGGTPSSLEGLEWEISFKWYVDGY